VLESKANKNEVDLIDTNGPEMEAMHREHILQVCQSPFLADLIPAAILPHREWIASRLNIFTLAYNTKVLKKADLPKSYEDFLKHRDEARRQRFKTRNHKWAHAPMDSPAWFSYYITW
jgi:iron(III) transport system substrate-binding protein